jgi:hypothetical protein
MEPYKTLVEAAGATFIAVKDGCVYFRDGADSPTLSLYTTAMVDPAASRKPAGFYAIAEARRKRKGASG